MASSESLFEERGEAPTIEVRVFRRRNLVQRELCESEEQAAGVDGWSDLDDVVCEVDDLSVRHSLGDVRKPEPAVPNDDD